MFKVSYLISTHFLLGSRQKNQSDSSREANSWRRVYDESRNSNTKSGRRPLKHNLPAEPLLQFEASGDRRGTLVCVYHLGRKEISKLSYWLYAGKPLQVQLSIAPRCTCRRSSSSFVGQTFDALAFLRVGVPSQTRNCTPGYQTRKHSCWHYQWSGWTAENLRLWQR